MQTVQYKAAMYDNIYRIYAEQETVAEEAIVSDPHYFFMFASSLSNSL